MDEAFGYVETSGAVTAAQSGATIPSAPGGSALDQAWWTVVARFLVHGLVVSTWVSRIPAVKSSLMLSDGALGVALLGTAVGSVIAIPVCGWVVTRFGSARACKWTGVGFSLGLMLIPFAVNTPTLFAALFVFGAMLGANDVAMNAQAVAVEKMLGTPTMSRFHAMFSLGGIFGAAVGGLVAARGVSATAHLLVGAVVILAFSLATAPGVNGGKGSSQPAPRVRLSLRRVPLALVALSVIGFCIFLSEGAIADWTAVYLEQVLGAGPGLAAAGYAVFSAAMALFRLCGDAITVRLGAARTIRAGGLLAAFGLGTALLVDSPYWALPGFAMAGAGFSSIIPLVFAAGGRVESVSEGAGVATVSGIGYLGFLAGPPTIGFVSQMSSLRLGLGVVVLLSAAAAMLVSATEPTKQPRNS
jgi:MFS family permease